MFYARTILTGKNGNEFLITERRVRIMNKKIPIAIGVAVVIIGIIIVGSKAYFGDSVTELPAEEKIEKSLNIQESGEAKSGEAGEAGESNEAGESGEARPWVDKNLKK